MPGTVILAAWARQPLRIAAIQQKLSDLGLESSQFAAMISSLYGRVLTTPALC